MQWLARPDMASPRLNRDDLQRLADIRIAEARTLLDSGYYSGAYYLTGYAVECALKACIARQVREFDFPDLRHVRNSYHHDFRILLETAGLRDEFRLETVSNPALSENWNIIAGDHGWKTDSRYMLSISEDNARRLFSAVANETAGMLSWIKRRW